MEVEIRFKELILWPAHTYSGTCAPHNNKNKIVDTVLVLHLSIFWRVYFIFKSLDLYMWLHDTVWRRKKRNFPTCPSQILPPTKVITRLHFITVHFLPALNSNINGNVQYILFGAHLFFCTGSWDPSIHIHKYIYGFFIFIAMFPILSLYQKFIYSLYCCYDLDTKGPKWLIWRLGPQIGTLMRGGIMKMLNPPMEWWVHRWIAY